MNLLLLLSALLSALTGVGGSVRAAEPAAIAGQATAVTTVAARVRRIDQARPVQTIGTRPERVRVVLAVPPAAPIPLFLLRRRE